MATTNDDNDKWSFVVSESLLHRGLGIGARIPNEEDKYEYIAARANTHRIAHLGYHDADLAFLVGDEDGNTIVWYPGVEGDGPHQVIVDHRYLNGDTFKYTNNWLSRKTALQGTPWRKPCKKYDQEQRDFVEATLGGRRLPGPIPGSIVNVEGDTAIDVDSAGIVDKHNLDTSVFQTVYYFGDYTLPDGVMEALRRVRDLCSKTDILPMYMLKLGVLNWWKRGRDSQGKVDDGDEDEHRRLCLVEYLVYFVANILRTCVDGKAAFFDTDKFGDACGWLDCSLWGIDQGLITFCEDEPEEAGSAEAKSPLDYEVKTALDDLDAKPVGYLLPCHLEGSGQLRTLVLDEESTEEHKNALELTRNLIGDVRGLVLSDYLVDDAIQEKWELAEARCRTLVHRDFSGIGPGAVLMQGGYGDLTNHAKIKADIKGEPPAYKVGFPSRVGEFWLVGQYKVRSDGSCAPAAPSHTSHELRARISTLKKEWKAHSDQIRELNKEGEDATDKHLHEESYTAETLFEKDEIDQGLILEQTLNQIEIKKLSIQLKIDEIKASIRVLQAKMREAEKMENQQLGSAGMASIAKPKRHRGVASESNWEPAPKRLRRLALDQNATDVHELGLLRGLVTKIDRYFDLNIRVEGPHKLSIAGIDDESPCKSERLFAGAGDARDAVVMAQRYMETLSDPALKYFRHLTPTEWPLDAGAGKTTNLDLGTYIYKFINSAGRLYTDTKALLHNICAKLEDWSNTDSFQTGNRDAKFVVECFEFACGVEVVYEKVQAVTGIQNHYKTPAKQWLVSLLKGRVEGLQPEDARFSMAVAWGCIYHISLAMARSSFFASILGQSLLIACGCVDPNEPDDTWTYQGISCKDIVSLYKGTDRLLRALVGKLEDTSESPLKFTVNTKCLRDDKLIQLIDPVVKACRKRDKLHEFEVKHVIDLNDTYFKQRRNHQQPPFSSS
ncbi:hypothetical protein PG991_013503 [Apiospora marii]|uniref:Uncharacterized protein n=1 Tax=Apiospora marii TaxID=335849 RepID=A0ABR1R687_9PEZI